MNKNKIIITIIFSIFFILSISTYYNFSKQNEYILNKNKQSFDVMQQMIDGKIIFFRKQFSARLRNILQNQNDLKNEILNNNQEKINNIIQRIEKILKKENKYSKRLQIISNENIAQNSKNNLTDVSEIIKYVDKKRRTKYGFAQGSEGMLYQVVMPIIYDKKYYGILEYSVDSNLFVDDLTSVSNFIESSVLIKKNINNSKLEENQINFSNGYFLYDTDGFFKTVRINNITKDIYFNHGEEYYATFLYDLLSFKGMSSAKILIAVNMTADKQRSIQMIKLSIINQIILILIIFLIVYYAFRYYETRIKRFVDYEKQSERILHQQSKMASMGEMIGNIAHQWRQPLSSISTIASGISVEKEYGLLDDSTIISSMDKIVVQTEYMSKTINDFRDFFKSDKEKVAFDLNEVITQNITLVEASFKSNDIKVISEFKADITLNGYQNELTQSILNILNNAKDQLMKLPKDTKKFVKIEIIQDENFVKIFIIDNAGGIEEDNITKIFEPYFTTKHQSQGTGIGLYMTHEIIVKHFDGDIVALNDNCKYKNVEYKCAKFIITIPIKASINNLKKVTL